MIPTELANWFVQIVLHFLWQGTAIALVAYLLATWIGQKSSRARYTIHVVALGCMPIVLAVTALLTPVPTRSADPLSPLDHSAASSVSNPITKTPLLDSSLENRNGNPDRGTQEGSALVAIPELGRHELAAVSLVSETAHGPASAPEIKDTLSEESSKLAGFTIPGGYSLPSVIVWIYLIGLGLMLLKLTLALVLADRLRRSAISIQEPWIVNLVNRMATRLGFRWNPKLCVSNRVTVPMVIGFFKPLIVLPASMLHGVSPTTMEALLTHELAHILRLDPLINLMQRLVETFLFFHPAVWFVSRQISIEREYCCDDLALRSGLTPTDYAEALLSLAERLFPTSQSVSLRANGGLFRGRILRLLEIHKNTTFLPTRGVFLSGLILIGALAGRSWLTSTADGKITDEKIPGQEQVASEGNQEPARVEHISPAPSLTDWPEWSGGWSRNNLGLDRTLPKIEEELNPQLRIKLGTRTIGSPLIASGKVLIGTNTQNTYLPEEIQKQPGGCLLCFDEQSGDLLWSYRTPATSETFYSGMGLISNPCVRGDKLWLATNNSEVVCLDLEGYREGEDDGPLTSAETLRKEDADVIWSFDLKKKLGIHVQFAAACSVTLVDDLILVETSHTQAFSKPVEAPSFIALNANTGELVWSYQIPGQTILDSSWSSPAVAKIEGVMQAIFGGGDGWVYAFDVAAMKRGETKLLWKFDINSKKSVYHVAPNSERHAVIAAPVVVGDRVYVAAGRNPEHGAHPGRIWCIDATKRGDISPELVYNKANPSQVVPPHGLQACDESRGDFTVGNPNSGAIWKYDAHDTNRNGKLDYEEQMYATISNPVIVGDLLFAADTNGFLHSLDIKTGIPHWHHDLKAAIWSTPLAINGEIYLGDEDGELEIYQASSKFNLLRTISFPHSFRSTPALGKESLFLATDNELFVFRNTKKLSGISGKELPESESVQLVEPVPGEGAKVPGDQTENPPTAFTDAPLLFSMKTGTTKDGLFPGFALYADGTVLVERYCQYPVVAKWTEEEVQRFMNVVTDGGRFDQLVQESPLPAKSKDWNETVIEFTYVKEGKPQTVVGHPSQWSNENTETLPAGIRDFNLINLLVSRKIEQVKAGGRKAVERYLRLAEEAIKERTGRSLEFRIDSLNVHINLHYKSIRVGDATTYVRFDHAEGFEPRLQELHDEAEGQFIHLDKQKREVVRILPGSDDQVSWNSKKMSRAEFLEELTRQTPIKDRPYLFIRVVSIQTNEKNEASEERLRAIDLMTRLEKIGFFSFNHASPEDDELRGPRTPKTTSAIPGLKWKSAMKGVETDPVIVGETVYVVSRRGEVRALALSTGEALWTYKTEKEAGFTAKPVIHEEIVCVGDDTGTMHALKRTTGELLWTFQTGGEIQGSVAFHKHLVLFGSHDQHLYALNHTNGTEAWRLKTEAPINATPMLTGGMALIACCDGRLRRLDVLAGRELASTPISKYLASAPLLEGDLAYLTAYEGEVTAIDWVTGRVAWKETESEQGVVRSPTLADDRLLIMVNNTLVARDKRSGKKVWEYQAKDKLLASPISDGNTLWIGTPDGLLLSLSKADGAILSHLHFNNPITGIARLDDQLVLSTEEGIVCTMK